MILKLKAELLKDIHYQVDGRAIAVEKGTKIVVDPENLIALVGNDHVDISQDEFRILYLN